MDDFGEKVAGSIHGNNVDDFPEETDHQEGDRRRIHWSQLENNIESNLIGQGYRSDLERSDHRNQCTEIIKNDRTFMRPLHSLSTKRRLS